MARPLRMDDDRPWWRDRLERWHELTGDDKLELLKVWCDDQDARQTRVDAIIKTMKWLIGIMVSAFLATAAQRYASSYQIVRTGQTILPAPTGAPTTAPDFQKTVPRPSP